MGRQTYEYIIGFDICMHDAKLAEMPEGDEKLVRVRTHGADVQADVFAKALDDVAEVHAEGR